MDILKSQAEFYHHLAENYDSEVGAEKIKSEHKYRRLFPEGTHFKRGLDIGCGTGNWTQGLLEVCDSVLAIDASSDMLEICKSKLGKERIEYRMVDVFQYPDLGIFDVVFSTFWISHVPPEEQLKFWGWVARLLGTGGQIIMQDSIDLGPGGGGASRKLPSGEKYDIVKIAYNFQDLIQKLKEFGIEAKVEMLSERIYVVKGIRDKFYKC